MKLDVLIPCENPKDNLLETINSLDKITEINKIFIIDDYSINDGGIYNFIKNNFKKVQIIKNIYKKGISGALNTGLYLSNSKYVAIRRDVTSKRLSKYSGMDNTLEKYKMGNHPKSKRGIQNQSFK